jgi:hypothetical protein
MVEILANEKNIHWDAMPLEYRFGFLFKKRAELKEVELAHNGKKVQALRQIPSFAPGNFLLDFPAPEELSDLLLEKNVPLDASWRSSFELYQQQ